ncbi:MAG TPA: pyrimidine utilization protein A [Acetobacteraceae bacterium]|nr:pyrimidine utilization protein A [Acetobacteraceae bacterium]
MQIGVFIPIGNNGWLISTTSPQYKPSFDLNRRITQRAEHYGLDFALSMIKLRGFGGPSEYWDHNLESFTLMAGLAAVTSRIQLFASVAVLTLPPPLAARMAVTIDSISGGRFGVNIVSGWQKAEYEQMGLWPGEAHFARRYDYCAEYVQVMRELWSDGHSDFQGSFFQMQDCRLSPRPAARIPLICAGQSERGMRFAAEYGDFNFVSGTGCNDPARAVPNLDRFNAEVARTGRDVGALVLVMVIADETDAAAMAKWEHYKTGTDHEALAWRRAQAGADVNAEANSTAGRFLRAENQLPTHMPTLIGSYATVARLLDTLGALPGVRGAMLAFDDFEVGIEQFGTRIQPLMRTRAGILAAA